MTSREAAEKVCGLSAVEAYGFVKRFYTRFGHALEWHFATAVDGRVGMRGERDVITRLGEWEFATQHNTKNDGNNKADLARVETGHAVQVLGVPNPGWISGIEFLKFHGVAEPEMVAAKCCAAAIEDAREPVQLSLIPLWNKKA